MRMKTSVVSELAIGNSPVFGAVHLTMALYKRQRSREEQEVLHLELRSLENRSTLPAAKRISSLL